MKTNLINFFNFGTADAQTWAGFVSLRKTQTKNMKKTRAIALFLGLVGAVIPPLLQAQTTETYTFTTNRVVPDGKAAGLADIRSVSSAIGTISSVKVRLKIEGEFNGDLYGYLRHIQNGVTNFCVLLNRPGKTVSNPAGYPDTGFDVTLQNGALNGDIHVYRDVAVPTSALTGIWQPDGRTADPSVVTDASDRTTSLTSFNGVTAAGEWTLFLSDVEAGGTNMLREWGIDITGGAYPTLAWSNPADIVYGTALSASQLDAVATYSSMNVPGTFTYTPALGTVLNTGNGQTLTVVFTPTDSASFLSVTISVSLNVTPAPLTIAANPKTKVYGGADPTLTYSVSGLQNGDTAGAVLSGALTRDEGEDAGTYSITQGTLAANAEYSIAFTGSTLTITKASTTGALVSSSNPALPGANVTFTMTLAQVAPGSGTPSGSVNFRIDGSIVGSSTLSAGVVTLTTSTLTHGTHTVMAEYAGSQNHIGATNSLAPVQIINTPPVANNLTIERYSGQGVKVRLSTLLTYASDADADGLTNAISTLTANGGTVSVSGDWVFFTPAPGDTNADSFTYTVGDAFGGTAVGTVTVTIKVDNEPAQNLTITDLGGGSFRINGSGIPGRTYRIQYTDSLATPLWQDLASATVLCDSNGVFVFTDTTAAPTRYYRSVYP